MTNFSVPGWVLPIGFITWQRTFSLMTQFHEEAVKIQLQQSHRKALTFLISEGVCAVKCGCWGPLLQPRSRERLSLRWEQQEGRHRLLPVLAPRNLVGALLASNSSKLWGSSGTIWEPRGPGKQKKGSFPAFATGNHEQKQARPLR